MANVSIDGTSAKIHNRQFQILRLSVFRHSWQWTYACSHMSTPPDPQRIVSELQDGQKAIAVG